MDYLTLLEGLNMAAAGPIFLGVMVALTALLNWPKWVNYVWAAVSILWGLMAL